MSDTFTDSAINADLSIDSDSTFSDAPDQEVSADQQEETPFEEPEVTPEVTPEPTPEQIQVPTPSGLASSGNFETDSSGDRTNIISPPDTSTASQTGSEEEPGGSSTTYTLDDLYKLLEAWQKEQQENRKTDQEALEEYKVKFSEYEEELKAHQEEMVEYRSYIKEQTRNIFSVNVLLLLSLAFASGILLARVVWRKL